MKAENQIPRILITSGEPAGVGPDILAQIAQQDWPAELIVVGDPTLLLARARQLDLTLAFSPLDFTQAAVASTRGTLKIIPVNLKTPCQAGQLNSANSPYVMQCLEIATDLCLAKKASALVTGPVNKNIINEAGIAFTGHTEFLAQRCGVKQDIMLFVVDELKVALATTHIPLAQVSAALTKEKLLTILRLLHRELQTKFHLSQPKILVCGLNPHAGENGLLGREEIEVITPVLQQLRAENMDVVGPLPADTIFTPKISASADVILAMYHDQALPVVKYKGFDRAVNITLGLPIIRTSVDHGTAVDIAGTNQVDAGSLKMAIKMAVKMTSYHLN